MSENSTRQVWAALKHVSKDYAGTRSAAPVRAVEDITVDIAEGEFVSVLGPSGCGKTTLLSMLAGLSSPTRGEVRIHEQKVTAPYPQMGIVFQRDLLLEWRTVRDNVLFQIEMRGGRTRDYGDLADQLLAQVGLAGFGSRYPMELSGGMRQRVAICRALVHNPEVLLLDEPFGALDSLTREQMNLDLQALWMQTHPTVLLITHDINEALLLSDRVLVMSARPGTIIDEIHVPQSRPRGAESVDSDQMRKLARHIREHFERIGVLRGAHMADSAASSVNATKP